MSNGSKESKIAKLGHHIEKVLIQNLFNDSENGNACTFFSIEAVCDAGIETMKHSAENKTTMDFLVRDKNYMCSHEINCNECKTRRVPRTEEKEID